MKVLQNTLAMLIVGVSVGGIFVLGGHAIFQEVSAGGGFSLNIPSPRAAVQDGLSVVSHELSLLGSTGGGIILGLIVVLAIVVYDRKRSSN